MDKTLLHKELAKTIVAKLRDENYENYLKTKEYARSISLTEYSNLPKNPHLDPEIQQRSDERFKLLNSLTDEQASALDKFVLNNFDSAAFNFLREVEENLNEDTSIGLTINGEKVEAIQGELLSGTLFGEYFLWVGENSKYGPFQH